MYVFIKLFWKMTIKIKKIKAENLEKNIDKMSGQKKEDRQFKKRKKK